MSEGRKVLPKVLGKVLTAAPPVPSASTTDNGGARFIRERLFADRFFAGRFFVRIVTT